MIIAIDYWAPRLRRVVGPLQLAPGRAEGSTVTSRAGCTRHGRAPRARAPGVRLSIRYGLSSGADRRPGPGWPGRDADSPPVLSASGGSPASARQRAAAAARSLRAARARAHRAVVVTSESMSSTPRWAGSSRNQLQVGRGRRAGSVALASGSPPRPDPALAAGSPMILRPDGSSFSGSC